MESKKEFFLECYKLGIIKFGRFTLKSGIESPFYVDLRPLASEPKILKHLANYLLEMLPLDNFDVICGVPYAALPMATAMSLESYIPLIIKRKLCFVAKSFSGRMVLSLLKSEIMSICVFRATICGPTCSANSSNSLVVVTSAEAIRLDCLAIAISKIFLPTECSQFSNFCS